MDRLLLIETSGRVGRVGLADGPALIAERKLDATRRHARDLAPAVAVTGPGLRVAEALLPAATPRAADGREPGLARLLDVGWERWRRGERDDILALGPLYLRPSSAEEQWDRLTGGR